MVLAWIRIRIPNTLASKKFDDNKKKFRKKAELGARLQTNVASRACASFSNSVASRAIAYFWTKKNRVISLSRHRVSRQ